MSQTEETFTPRWDDAPHMVHRLRCPRCGCTTLVGKQFTLTTAEGITYKLHELYCTNCSLFEDAETLVEGAYDALLARWEDPRVRTTTKEWIAELDRGIALRDKHEREARWPPDPDRLFSSERRDELIRLSEPDASWTENFELLAAVAAAPDDDSPRRAYAAWMRAQSVRMFPNDPWAEDLKERPMIPGTSPSEIADFIDGQLEYAENLRKEARFDLDEQLQGKLWRLRPSSFEQPINILNTFEWRQFYRGFIGRGDSQARFFLMYADEIFNRAPIQHLTLTYCKPHIEQLAALPDMWRIRSLRLPERNDKNKHMRLNELTDHEIRVLASSPHLGGLAHLDLEDAALSVRAMDHLALSPYLTSLSHVRVDHFAHVDFSGPFGIETEKGAAIDRLAGWAEQLEARHGYLPWLHAEEHYGTRTPHEERVTEHPIGKASFRPDIAARTRPRLTNTMVEAIAGRIDSNRLTIRDRALIAHVPSGRLVGTLEKVAKHATLDPDVAVLVTMSVQQAPAGIEVYDQATQKRVTLAARSTVTLLVPTFAVSLGHACSGPGVDAGAGRR
jgi:hypothetical protein